MESQERRMQEGMDFRLTVLLLLRKTGYIITAGIIGALVAGGVYLLTHVVYAPAREYQAVSRYYIDFTVDENGDRAYDYYNAATWNDVAASDPILDYTMSLLPDGYDKEQVREAVFCEQPSDYRIITTTVTTGDQTKTAEIQKATEASILHYGEMMEEFEKISVIMSSEVTLVALDLHTVKVFVLGGIGGVLLMLLWLIFQIILDTSIYVESTFERRYGYPVLGVFFRDAEKNQAQKGNPSQEATGAGKMAAVEKGDTHRKGNSAVSGRDEKHWMGDCLAVKKERNVNLAYLGGGNQIVVPLWDRESEAVARLAGQSGCKSSAGLLEHPESCEQMRETDGVILAVRSGKDQGKQLDKAISLLEKQDCKITGAILYRVSPGIYQNYYRFRV